MTDNSGPSLADDEEALQRYARQLADAIDTVGESWLLGLVSSRSEAVAAALETVEAISGAASNLSGDMAQLLELDIAEQMVGPLELLRRAIAVPTQLLRDAGIGAVDRDEFSRTNFPDDVYDLTPASFAAVDPSLHEPGLMWGAAKAHVHLRRRRESPAG